MKFSKMVWCGVLSLAAPLAQAGETSEKTQEYYDRQVAESLQAMTEELQTATGEMVKYMNALNKAFNDSMPQISQNMGNLLKSMKPMAETMQKNADNFAREIDAQFNEPLPAAAETIPEDDDINTAIDKELSELGQNDALPQKIKLFPSSVE